MSLISNQDYSLWLEKTAQLLREGQWHAVDVEGLAQEIEAMGRSEKRAVKSNLIVLLMHLLKMKRQPEKRTESWRSSIVEHRRRLLLLFEDSPSLRGYFLEVFNTCYSAARQDAAVETRLPVKTFPAQSPFSVDQVLDVEYLSE